MRAGKPKWVDEVLSMRRSPEEWKEGQHLEFKESRERLTSDLWETYSAFANTEGGVIVLGVTDGGRIKGVPNPDKQMKDLVNTLNNDSKVSLNLCGKPDSVCVARVEGQALILINVPPAEVKDKPVYLNGRTGNCFLRQNEADIRCTRDNVDQMNRDASAVSYVPKILPGAGLEAIDRTTFAQYRNRMRSYKPEHPWVQLDDLELLGRLKGYATDAATGESGLTLEGVLMFGTEEAIIRYCPQLQLDYFEYDGEEGGSVSRRWVDRICNDGTWVPNLYQFFFRVLPRLQQRLKNPFRLKADMTTAQGDSPAHVAVREALANAVVHADYLGVGGVCIRQYPDKLLLENPGTLLLPKRDVLRGGMSRCRNMALQSMFMMMGIADRAGSGIDKIMLGWADQCLLPPMVDEQRVPARVVWRMPFVGILPKEGEELLREHFGAERFDVLEPLHRLILMIVAAGSATVHREIKALLPFVHSSDLTHALVSLAGGGFLACAGRTTAAKYSIADNMHGEKWGGFDGNALPQDDAKRAQCDWRSLLPANVPEGLIRKIDETRKKGRIDPELLDELVLKICAYDWMTLPRLAFVLERTPAYLRRKCLQALVRHGMLLLKFEDATHPAQAYKTKGSGIPKEPK